MTANQLDRLFEQVHRLVQDLEIARAHNVRLQDQLEALKSKHSTPARKAASRKNGLKGGRPRKNNQ